MNTIMKRIILLAIFTLFSSSVLAAELSFGGQTLTFPESTKIQLISQTSAPREPLSLKKPNPDDRNDYQKFRDTFENLGRAGYVSYYQLVAPSTTGIKQAFFVTVRIPQENFSLKEWSSLFPDNTAKDTFLGDYMNNLDQQVKNNAGHPIEIETDLSEKIFLLHFKKPSGFFVKDQEILASSASILIDTAPEFGTRVLDTQAFFVPLYFYHFGWQYQNDYYFCLLVAMDGEQDFWKETPRSFYLNNKEE